MKEETQTENAAAHSAHETTLRGLKGEIQGGSPGERRTGRTTAATSDGFREAKESPRIIITDARPRKSSDEAQGHRLASLLKGYTQSELRRKRRRQRLRGIEDQRRLAERKLGSLRSHFEFLVAEKLIELLNVQYEKIAYGAATLDERMEFFFLNAQLANLPVLQKILLTKISQLEEELRSSAAEAIRLSAELED